MVWLRSSLIFFFMLQLRNYSNLQSIPWRKNSLSSFHFISLIFCFCSCDLSFLLESDWCHNVSMNLANLPTPECFIFKYDTTKVEREKKPDYLIMPFQPTTLTLLWKLFYFIVFSFWKFYAFYLFSSLPLGYESENKHGEGKNIRFNWFMIFCQWEEKSWNVLNFSWVERVAW